MVEPLLVIGGIAAGIYAAISGKKEPAPSASELTKAAIPLAAAQVKAGVPVGVAVQAASGAVIDVLFDRIYKAGICVLKKTPPGGTRTRPTGGERLPAEVVKRLLDKGWRVVTKSVSLQQAAGLGSVIDVSYLWKQKAEVMVTIEYLCPPGKFPPGVLPYETSAVLKYQ